MAKAWFNTAELLINQVGLTPGCTVWDWLR